MYTCLLLSLVSVNLYMIHIMSKAGDDFTSVAMMVTFSAGQSHASVSVPIIDDILGEMSEVFTGSLSAVTGNVVIGKKRISDKKMFIFV